MLRTETFEFVKADETFLDLAIESREVILPLGSSNSDIKFSSKLDSHVFDREGDDWSVCYVLDEEVFAVFHQMADA